MTNMAPVSVSLLRSPPFPAYPTKRSPRSAPTFDCETVDRDELFEAVRQARVGGAFWGEGWQSGAAEPKEGPQTLLRAVNKEEVQGALAALGAETAVHLPLGHEHDALDPWSILPQSRRLIAHGNDEWAALAAIMGIEVDIVSPGQFGQPGDSAETLAQCAFEALIVPMPDPFHERWMDPIEAVALLGDWRRALDGNRGAPGERIVAACGMSWWKREEIRRFLWSPGPPLSIHRSSSRALDAASKQNGALAVWPSRISKDLEKKAKRKGVKLVRVEDGFVRSVGLGSNLVPPLSVIVDRSGIHYDPSRPSDLETLLNAVTFSQNVLARARRLRTTIIEGRISKYGSGKVDPAKPKKPRASEGKRIVLVPGQVEDDMSVLFGGQGLESNLELLRRVRDLEPEAEIWWRPHPDVDAGHRKGTVDDAAALEHADRIVREGSMSDLFDQVDALHTITSLSGFEALMRGCEVTCHGVPFYAGWGLTRDLGEVPARRNRSLSLDELVAGVLLLYPRYLDPVTGLPCPAETLVQRLADGEADNRLGWVQPLRQMQGRIMRQWREVVSR